MNGMSDQELDELLMETPKAFLSFYRWSNPAFPLIPDHMPELLDAFESTLEKPYSGCFSAPPQHGKSVLILTGLCWYAYLVPGCVSAYVSYSDDIALSQSDQCWKIAEAAGLGPTGTKSKITLANGSVILFTSIGGPLEGKAVTGWLVLDDPYKSMAEASSSVIRRGVESWFNDTGLGRTHPTTSVFVIGHRWVPDDLIAALKTQGWSWKNYEAIFTDDEGNKYALWPALKPLEWLEGLKGKTLPSTWEAEYQGNPQATGSRIFEGVYRYPRLPDSYEVAIGLDLATTAKSSADWSAIVVMASSWDTCYILWAGRYQTTAPQFLKECLTVAGRYPGAMWRWYAMTSEIGAGQFMQAGGLDLQIKIAKTDKKIRATPYAAAWYHKKVLVPENAPPWLKDFLAEHKDFTGVDDFHDDFVDAAAAAFDLLPRMEEPAPAVVPGTPEWFQKQNLEMRKGIERDIRHNTQQEFDDE